MTIAMARGEVAPDDDRHRKTANQRRWRRLAARGQRVAKIQIDAIAVAEALINAGLLAPAGVDDDAKVDAALAIAIKHWSSM